MNLQPEDARIVLSGRTFNEIMRKLRPTANVSSGQAEDEFPSTIVWVQNKSSGDRKKGEALGIDDGLDKTLFDPNKDEGTIPSDQIVLLGVMPKAEHVGRFVVLLQPLAKDDIGRAVLLGPVWARGIADEGDTTNMRAEIVANSSESSAKYSLRFSAGGSAKVLYRSKKDKVEGWTLVDLNSPVMHTYFEIASSAQAIVATTSGASTALNTFVGRDFAAGAAGSHFTFSASDQTITVKRTGIYLAALNARVQFVAQQNQWSQAHIILKRRANSSIPWTSASTLLTIVFDYSFPNVAPGSLPGIWPLYGATQGLSLIADWELRVEAFTSYSGGTAPTIQVTNTNLGFTNLTT